MGVWNSSKQTVHDIIPVFLLLSLSQDKQKVKYTITRKHLS